MESAVWGIENWKVWSHGFDLTMHDLGNVLNYEGL